MIKKLKRRFILTSMAVVTLVLLLVSIVLFLGARRVVYSDADQMLKRSLMFSLGEKGNGEGRGGRFERAVVLTVDPETGEVENRSSGTLQNFSEEEQQELAQEAARGGKLKNRGVRASVEKRNGKTYVAVVDTAVEDRLLTAATKALALFAAGTWAALLLLVWLLSGWAVRPMAKAWDMQRQFVADASHDLKTPLTVILSNSELLKQQSEAADTPEVDRIEAAGRRMKDLVQKMLTLARMEDDPNRGAWESMDLSDMVMEGALAFEATAFEKGLTMATGLRSRASSNACWTTPASTPIPGAASPCPWRRRGRGPSSPFTTPAPTSPRRTFPTCSSASIGRTRAARPPIVPAWASLSSSPWWSPWAAPSPSKAPNPPAPPSRCSSSERTDKSI